MNEKRMNVKTQFAGFGRTLRKSFSHVEINPNFYHGIEVAVVNNM